MGRYDILLGEQPQNNLKQPAAPTTRPNEEPLPATPTGADTTVKGNDNTEAGNDQNTSKDRDTKRSIVRSTERTDERTFERTRTRHSFDVFMDQITSLREIALKREGRTGDRVLLGDLAQEALDDLIRKEKNR